MDFFRNKILFIIGEVWKKRKKILYPSSIPLSKNRFIFNKYVQKVKSQKILSLKNCILKANNTRMSENYANVLFGYEENNLNEYLKIIRRIIYTPYGKWIKEGWIDEKAKNGIFVKVVSYNILAQSLLELHPELYSKHDKRYLCWEYRSNLLINEFIQFDADVLCLQEVEVEKIDFFERILKNLGYKGIFKKRTREKNDGCAIYFRENKFNLKEHSFVEYFQPNVNLLNRDNIGIVVRLALRNLPDKTIVVATTHLLYNPKRHDIKLAQMQILLAEIDRIAYKSTDESGKAIYFPIILTGDFNLKPYTIVHDLIMNGFVKKSWNCYCQAPHKYSSMTHLPYTKLLPFRLGITDSCQHYNVIQNRNSIQREISDFKFVKLYNSERKSQSTMYNNHDWRRLCLDYNKFDSCWLHHDLNFGSVYSYDKDGINDVTTFQSEWCTVDYIFYGPLKKVDELKIDGDLKLLSYLKLPNVSQANILRVIPNEVCSSDHLPLLATFHLPIDV